MKVASEPEALLTAPKNPSYHFKRIEIGSWAAVPQWLGSALSPKQSCRWSVLETRYMQCWVLKRNRSTRRTAMTVTRGIAQMMCGVGFTRPVHVKTLRSQKLRMMLTHRKLLQSEGHRHRERSTGYFYATSVSRFSTPGRRSSEARIKELVENLPPDLVELLIEPLLIVRRALREQLVILHRRLLAIVRNDEVCRRLMTTPGVGPVAVALTLSCHRRCACSVPKIQVSRRGIWTGRGFQVSTPAEIRLSGRISTLRR